MVRFFAAIFMMPLLVVIANTIAVGGAYVISDYFLGISFDVFFDSVKRFFTMGDFIFGMIHKFYAWFENHFQKNLPDKFLQ